MEAREIKYKSFRAKNAQQALDDLYAREKKLRELPTKKTNEDFTVTTSNDIVIILARSNIMITVDISIANKIHYIKNIGEGTIKVSDSSGALIDGDSEIELIEHESISIVSDGGGWWIL